MSTQPSWPAGPLFAAYYDANRKALPGELAFWQETSAGYARVLEIGAGTGFISQVLARNQPTQLTLVEPDADNVQLLRQNLAQLSLPQVPLIVAERFQAGHAPQELIVFPYDSLPVIVHREQRKQLALDVAAALVPGGCYVVHFSTAKWNQAHLDTVFPMQRLTTRAGLDLEVHRQTRRDTEVEYSKILRVVAPQLDREEQHTISTAIVIVAEVVADCQAAGLRLVAHYTDFFRTPSDGSETDDNILVFERAGNCYL